LYIREYLYTILSSPRGGYLLQDKLILINGDTIPLSIVKVLLPPSLPCEGNYVTSEEYHMSLQDLMKRYFRTAVESIFTSLKGVSHNTTLIEPNTDPMINVPFLSAATTFTLAAAVDRGDTVFTAVAAHGISVGDIIELAEGQGFTQGEVLVVATNVITIDTPASQDFTAAAVAQHASQKIEAANGSLASPVIFSVLPLASPIQKGEIHRVMIFFEDNSAMDFTTFASAARLTNGCVMRVKNADGDYENLFNFKDNGEISLQGGNDIIFPEKTGGGGFGAIARISFQGEDKRGVVIELDGAAGEILEIVIQDNIAALNISKFRMVAQGHLTF
jgi:hypothetical protein